MCLSHFAAPRVALKVVAPIQKVSLMEGENLLELAKTADEISRVEVGGAVSREEFDAARASLDRLLTAFPLLYGVWVRLSRLVWTGTGEWSAVEEVFRKAVDTTGLKYSPELWTEFVRSASSHAGTDEARRVLLLSLASVGDHFMSGPLWKALVDLEKQREMGRPLFVLAHAVAHATQDLKEMWEELQSLLPRTSIQQLLALDLDVPLPEALERPLGELGDGNEHEIRAAIAEKLAKVYEASLDEVLRRSKFETAITRHYFHFQAPDDSQIENWEAYIEMLRKTGAPDQKIIELYERALIPCNYIECVWMNYADFMEERDPEAARSVYERIPFNVIPRAKITFAEFLEQYGDPEPVYDELAASSNAEQAIAAAHFWMRKQSDKAPAVLREARDRMVAAGDADGAGLVAAELLQIAGEASDELLETSASYVSSRACLAATDDPDAANTTLYTAVFQSPAILLEDRVTLLEIYVEYLRQWGSEAAFQLEMEITLQKMKNQLIWHRHHFDQSFLASTEAPENRLHLWIEYQKGLVV